MKVLLFAGGSRAGLEFFLSLLDGHTEILQFPGTIRGNKKLLEILASSNSSKICSDFIDNYKHFFDSRLSNDIKLSVVERHTELGEDKKHYYLVNEEKFKFNFIKLFEERNKSQIYNKLYQNLLMLFQAYSIAKGEDIEKKKILVINCHLISYLRFIDKKIMRNINYDIIHTIRNPLSAISSPLNNWLRYKSGCFFFSESIYFHIDLVVNGIKKLRKINKNIFLIKLESLHRNNLEVMKDFCKSYALTYEECMKRSTFLNLKWWGDTISGKNLDGINKNIEIKFDKKNFYDRDIDFLESILKNYLDIYKYLFVGKNLKNNFNFLPMKCEIITWKNTFKHKNIKNIFLIPFFYLKRIIFINKFSQKNLPLPRVFGDPIIKNKL